MASMLSAMAPTIGQSVFGFGSLPPWSNSYSRNYSSATGLKCSNTSQVAVPIDPGRSESGERLSETGFSHAQGGINVPEGHSEASNSGERRPLQRRNFEKGVSREGSLSPEKQDTVRPRVYGTSRWSPEMERVSEVIERLRNAEDSEGGGFSAMAEWDAPLSSRNIVSILNNMESWKKAMGFFKWLKSKDAYEVNSFTYNVLLKILRKGKQWSISENIVNEMITNSIPPDNYTYSTLINCATRCDYPEEAIKWFEKMKAAGCMPDEVTYSSLIDAYGKSGRTEEALALYERLRASSWHPDPITFGAVANVYAKKGDYDAIGKILRDMKEMSVRPNVVIYNTYIGALSKAGKVSLARKALEEMEGLGIAPTKVTLSILIDMYSRVGAADSALEVYERMKKQGINCDLLIYNLLINSCVEYGMVEKAHEVLHHIKAAGCRPNHFTYKSLMNVYATRGMVDVAKHMFGKIIEEGIEPDTNLYIILIRGCRQGRRFKEVPDLLNEIIKREKSIDDRVTGVVLSCLTVCQEDEERELIMECISKCNPQVYYILCQLAAPECNMDEVQKAIKHVICIDTTEPCRRPLCNTLVDLCWKAGAKDRACEVMASGISLGLYDGLQTRTDAEWRLNLRTLSLLTAECALENWIKSLSRAIEQEENLPSDLVVETGVGKSREPGQRLNVAIGTRLKSLASPFTESKDPVGYFFTSGSYAESWLRSRKQLASLKT